MIRELLLQYFNLNKFISSYQRSFLAKKSTGSQFLQNYKFLGGEQIISPF